MKSKFINIQKTCESTKRSHLCSQKNNFEQRISIVEDGASGKQVGDIEKLIVKNCSNIIALYETDKSLKNKLL